MTKSNKKNRLHYRKSTLVATSITIIVLALLFAVYYFSGWFNYANGFIKCGFHQPIQATDFAAAGSYSLPGNGFYHAPGLFTDKYYCTEDQAQSAGYRLIK